MICTIIYENVHECDKMHEKFIKCKIMFKGYTRMQVRVTAKVDFTPILYYNSELLKMDNFANSTESKQQ